MQNDLKYSDITQKIIGCAMKVHGKMRNGYSELIYARCLEIEFKKERIEFRKELELPVYYEDILVGKKRVDFLIEQKIIVELKAISALSDQNLAQALNYLECHKLEVGLLINFGARSLEFKRVINHRGVSKENPANPLQTPINPRL